LLTANENYRAQSNGKWKLGHNIDQSTEAIIRSRQHFAELKPKEIFKSAMKLQFQKFPQTTQKLNRLYHQM